MLKTTNQSNVHARFFAYEGQRDQWSSHDGAPVIFLYSFTATTTSSYIIYISISTWQCYNLIQTMQKHKQNQSYETNTRKSCGSSRRICESKVFHRKKRFYDRMFPRNEFEKSTLTIEFNVIKIGTKKITRLRLFL